MTGVLSRESLNLTFTARRADLTVHVADSTKRRGDDIVAGIMNAAPASETGQRLSVVACRQKFEDDQVETIRQGSHASIRQQPVGAAGMFR